MLKAVVRGGGLRVFRCCRRVTVCAVALLRTGWALVVGKRRTGLAATTSITVSPSPAASNWGLSGATAAGTSAIKSLDARLARGVYATIGPCGGITRRRFQGCKARMRDDVALQRGSGRQGRDTPITARLEVEQVWREEQRQVPRGLGRSPGRESWPSTTPSWFDNLWLDNLNRQGVELTRKTLGFHARRARHAEVRGSRGARRRRPRLSLPAVRLPGGKRPGLCQSEDGRRREAISARCVDVDRPVSLGGPTGHVPRHGRDRGPGPTPTTIPS